MLIAIGTLRQPKVEAVKKSFEISPYFQGKILEYLAQSTDSNVSDMPLNIEEIMLGAKNRVKNLRKSISNADYYVGLEGGTSKIGDKYFLFGVSYIENLQGAGHIGISPMIEIPNQIQKELYANKKDLGDVMDQLSGKNQLRSQNGAFGELTDGMITREQSFILSTQFALAPFFNKYWKDNSINNKS